MTTASDVVALAPSEIVCTASTAQQQEHPTQQAHETQSAQLGAEQTAAIAQLATMRAEAALLPDSPARDSLHSKIGKLAAFAVAGGERPAWYGEQTADPKLSDQSEHDSLATTLAAGFEPITAADREGLESHARVAGVPHDVVGLVGDFAMAAELDAVGAGSLATRVAEVGWNAELNDTQRAELTQKVYAAFGSAEKAHREGALALAYLEHMGLSDWATKFGGNLGYDPHVVLALAGKARMLGLKAKGRE